MGKVGTQTCHGHRPAVQAFARQLLACVGLAALCGCGMVSQLFEAALPEKRHRLKADLDPSIASYLIAELCRRQLPGADPVPMHRSPPVVHHGSQAYEVHYVRHGGEGFRVFQNGRITPPKDPPLRTRPGPCPLSGCRFLAGDGYSGTPAAASEQLRITIDPVRTPDGRLQSLVQVYLYGLPAEGRLFEILEAELTVATTVQITAELLHNRQFEAADRLAATALAALDATGIETDANLRARLLCHRAAAADARGDVLTVQKLLGLTLDLDDGLRVARYWLFRTERRLARIPDAGHNLVVLSASDLAPSEQAQVRASLVKTLVMEDRPANTGPLEHNARQALEDWDLPAAMAWARLAVARGSESIENRAVLSRVHTLRAEHRQAFEEELLLFAGGCRDHGLILRMARRQLTLKNAPEGLRLLARHWNQLLRNDPRNTAAVLRSLTLATGSEMACRILVSEGADELARRQLAGWRATGRAGAAATALLERVPGLRESHRRWYRARPAPGVQPPRTGYESAPGVTPGR